jgi:hypothetical protein
VLAASDGEEDLQLAQGDHSIGSIIRMEPIRWIARLPSAPVAP